MDFLGGIKIPDPIGSVLLSYIIFFLFSIAFLSYRVKKQTGVFPIIKNSDNVYGFVDKLVLFSYLLVIVNTLFYIFGEVAVYKELDLFPVKMAGMFIITNGLLFMFISQLQMGKSWRIGIDAESEFNMVDEGFFRHLRHPIYFFAVMIGFGMLVIIPNVTSLFTFFVLWAMVSIQSRLEEEFMLSKFGKKYKKFMSKRKRWFS